MPEDKGKYLWIGPQEALTNQAKKQRQIPAKMSPEM
jgi:hypothetical protein